MSYRDDLKEIERQEGKNPPPKVLRPSKPAPSDKLAEYRGRERTDGWEPEVL